MENTFIGNYITKPKDNYILVQEFQVESPLFLKIAKPDLDPLMKHVLRIERYIGDKNSGSNAKFVKPVMTDFDNFMRGNPHPNPPKIL